MRKFLFGLLPRLAAGGRRSLTIWPCSRAKEADVVPQFVAEHAVSLVDQRVQHACAETT